MPELNSKLPNIGTTIFTVMSALAQEHGAINLSQGFPDFPAPADLVDLVSRYMQEGFNQYPPMTGVPYLREQVAAKIASLYGVSVDMDEEITVTSGATESLYVAIQAVINPGDEAIVLDPAYDAYEPAISLAGGTTRHIPLQAPDFRPDWQRLKDTLSSRTRLVIINSPHNPCGGVLSKNDLDELAYAVRDSNAFILSDEVYEHMVFDGAQHISVLSHPELRRRAFAVFSFGKTYHATGWKVAYCIAPPTLTAEFRKIHQFVTFTTHTPTQWALAEYLETHAAHYLELPAFYQRKRDLFVSEMGSSGFRMTPSQGTYFQLADYSGLSNMPDVEFARYLTTDIGVAAIPISVFCAEPPAGKFVRFCFCKDDDTLREAAARLHQLEPVGD